MLTENKYSFWTLWFWNFKSYPGESNGNPLQYSCLENPMVEKPGKLQSMGSLRVRHDWPTSLSLFTFFHWRRKWQPTSVFLPGESHGRRSLVGYSQQVAESDTTERIHWLRKKYIKTGLRELVCFWIQEADVRVLSSLGHRGWAHHPPPLHTHLFHFTALSYILYSYLGSVSKCFS